VPKAFAKLRKAVRAGNAGRAAKQRHGLEHVAVGVHRFADRSFVAYLRASKRWGGRPVSLGHPELSPSRIVLPVELGERLDPVAVALEEQNGWVIGLVAEAGGLAEVGPEARAAFADALIGLYKRAGVDVVREQVAAVFGPQAYQFDAVPEGLAIVLSDGKKRAFDYEDGPEIGPVDCRLPTTEVVLSECPLRWADWVARWEADAAGKAPRGPLIPGWTFVPGDSSG
jgi:hypothetical protein